MRDVFYKALNIIHPVVNTFFKNRLRVLAYHDIIDPVTFESQLLWLKTNYHIIDISTLRDHLFYNKELRANSLLITLDDGDKTVYTNGLPIFKKYQIPVCLFIITELISTNKDFWWNTIIKNEKKKGYSQVEIMKIVNKNKSMLNKQRIEFLKQYPLTYQDQLTTSEIRELKGNRVYIGNHSHTHPMFDKLDKDELLEELNQAGLLFKKNGIGDFSVFAYPNGNFNESAENLLLDNGIEIAFLFDHKINEKKINPLRISRIAVDSDTPLPEFKTKVSGLHPMIWHVAKQF
ncbi:polysaccharide deacetylase family protein [Zunongwangia sp. F260]|uniref:Polysaccharide deacetylase family protein n=1 Tax=Autumnicola lenta TaxID=3075593 RepID=A0ABU3CHS9_9FLAO|nr:polysaccharide deacetylase family protein [Zunongwangia sp. F260]MDT0645905.1 polysaccharide deacetylase family protein [Zunongwangia sp. F260]